VLRCTEADGARARGSGDAGYVGSEYYIKTPGDAWEEAHKARD